MANETFMKWSAAGLLTALLSAGCGSNVGDQDEPEPNADAPEQDPIGFTITVTKLVTFRDDCRVGGIRAARPEPTLIPAARHSVPSTKRDARIDSMRISGSANGSPKARGTIDRRSMRHA